MTTFATLLTLATVALVFAIFKMGSQMSENNSSRVKPIRVETEEEQRKRYRNRR
ncbi:hypothetical protein [Neptuniibacter sp.]|uniref:hypothetical protein n=1 Tax=Neptuniibacter sp. TaxID=1962643 RepID=UPI00260F2926|nr:hypothetical protein [Neptuniibacter sp.]MCP4598669.1 hypothetical protein [Neptuniibacter sp.]